MALDAVSFTEDHNPIIRSAERVGPRRVRKQRGERPAFAIHVQDRKPRRSGWIETAGRYLAEAAGGCFAAVVLVHREHEVDVRRLGEDGSLASTDPRRLTGAAAGGRRQEEPEHLLQRTRPPRPESRQGGETPVVSGLLELFERGDTEPIVNPRGQRRPNAGNG